MPRINYFSVSRTQPFLITLFQAIFFLKKCAKLIAKRLMFAKQMRLKKHNKLSSLRLTIDSANEALDKAREGNNTIELYDLPMQKEKPASYNYHTDPTVIAYFMRKKKMKYKGEKKENICLLAARQITNFNRSKLRNDPHPGIFSFIHFCGFNLLTHSSSRNTAEKD